MSVVFQRYFTLDEAVALLPAIQESLEAAQLELAEIKDHIILYKRIHLCREEGNETPTPEEEAVLQQKWQAYEASFERWHDYFTRQGIILRDIDRGLVDFPYRARSTGEDFLLCWHLGEEGLFYFHDAAEGFAGRKPISLLPE